MTKTILQLKSSLDRSNTHTHKHTHTHTPTHPHTRTHAHNTHTHTYTYAHTLSRTLFSHNFHVDRVKHDTEGSHT